MPSINLSNYYSAGYFVIRANDPPGWDLPERMFPDYLVSLSECICRRLSLFWETENWNETVAEFGIPAERFDDFAAWCRQGEYISEVDYLLGMFFSVEAARRFISRFMPDTTNLYIIGVGFPRELANLGWRGPHYERQVDTIEQRIAQRLPLESGGDVLGHEIVSFDYGDFGHSWICNHIYEEPFGFSPNSRGFIDTYDDAKKVYDWLAEDDMKGTRGEPEPYYIWLLLSYPLFLDAGE